MRRAWQERYRVILLVLVFLVLSLGHRALFIELDNSPETFFSSDKQSQAVYRSFVDSFGPDELILVHLRNASPLDEQVLLDLAKLTRDIESIEGVTHVLSLSKIFDTGVGPLPEKISEQRRKQVETELQEVPFYSKLGMVRFRSSEHAEPAIGLLVSAHFRNSQDRTRLTSDLDRVLVKGANNIWQPIVAGLTPTHVAFDRLTKRSLLYFMPMVVLMSLLVSLFLFRSFSAILVLFLPVLGSVVLGIAGLEVAHQSLNLVTAVLPPIVLTIGIASSLHILTHYATLVREGSTPRQAVVQTIREKSPPTAFGFMTTAIGFGSLGLSNLSSVRVLGIASALTLLVSLVLVIIGTPALLLWLRPSIHSPSRRQMWLERLAFYSLKHRIIVFLVSILLLVFVIAGTAFIRQSINGVQLLSPNAPERVSYELLESEGLGLANFELWIKTEVRGFNALKKEHRRLRILSNSLSEHKLVTGTFSAADLMDVAEFRMKQADTNPAISRQQTLKAIGGDGAYYALLSSFWGGRDGLRMSVLTHNADDQNLLQEQRIMLMNRAREVFPKAEINLTGHYSMLIGSPSVLLKTLARSLGVTIAIVTVLFFLFFRSFVLSISGMVVNLVPVVVVLGVMGWLDISLDVATVMTGSVVFGLAVDDTFHYLYHRKKSGSIRCAAATAGQGIVATTFVLSAGFATLGLSGFSPVLRFGLLTSFAALIALAVDTFLLPALVARPAELEEVTCTEKAE